MLRNGRAMRSLIEIQHHLAASRYELRAYQSDRLIPVHFGWIASVRKCGGVRGECSQPKLFDRVDRLADIVDANVIEKLDPAGRRGDKAWAA